MWKLSTGLRNALLEAKHYVPAFVNGTTFSFGSGTGTNGADRITDSANGLGVFKVGDWVTIKGASSSNNNKVGKIILVTPGYIDITGAGLVTEAAGVSVAIISATGGSIAGIFRAGVMRIYSGTQPTTADDAETGILLCEITQNSGAFTPGSTTNGINFGLVSNGTIHKAENEIWSGINIATGTAGWFRIYANDRTTGLSTTACRLDGACATSGAQMNLTTTSLVAGVTTTIDLVNLTMPAQ